MKQAKLVSQQFQDPYYQQLVDYHQEINLYYYIIKDYVWTVLT